LKSARHYIGGMARTALASLLVVCVLALIAFSACADDLQNGDAAYHAGNYSLAFQWYLEGASSDDNGWDEFNLGVMFYRGLGVGRNAHEGEYWLLPPARPAQGSRAAPCSLAQHPRSSL
jgi:TPR repeat protein